MIGFIHRLFELNEKKLYELVIIERIDRVFIHIIKSYLGDGDEIRERVYYIVKRIMDKK
jgi:hypothetical protein